jgi:hypothetical protein
LEAETRAKMEEAEEERDDASESRVAWDDETEKEPVRLRLWADGGLRSSPLACALPIICQSQRQLGH